MARAIDSEAAYRFLSEQLVKETGAFSKGVNKGLNIARSAMRNPDAIPALRPVSRERVEQVWGGMWIYDPDTGYAYCEMCKHTICKTDYLDGKLPPFCEMCSTPMTDEAVEVRLKELGAMYGQENT